MDIIKGLEPASFWKHFYNLTRIPRESGNEEGVRKYVSDFADAQGLEYKIDAIGNIIIKRPAAPGREKSPSVVLQGHMDMVCEKNRDKVHDFAKDPIALVIEDGWLKADGTTLGADNGVAVAAGLAVLESDEALGPVEVLLTVDEETGLTGAMELDPSIVDSRILINLDSEEDGVVYVGCAGGKNTEGYLPVDFEAVPAGYSAFALELKGLKGGHSGGEIHIGLGNAIKLGSRFIWNAAERYGARLAYLEGGGKHNVIARECFASLLVKDTDTAALLGYADEYAAVIKSELSVTEPNLSFELKPTDVPAQIYSEDSQQRILDLIYALPHGVVKMSKVLENLVETSTNLARVELLKDGKGVEASNSTGETEFFVQNCHRSSVDTECDDIADSARACIRAAGGRCEIKHEYPGWDPNPQSEILKTAEAAYKNIFGHGPEIKAIHAGLECGVIGKKFESIDMVSFGPELADVHTPGEKMEIKSVENAWKFLMEILRIV
ncbi:MAG: aminoacyl-histidine dipeptidase [Spirochaetales bacterium]|uniref:Cytosol non-specific dipeptidase n=1 Tax=Candidatus Thalassospirochaeta sargassi TaxID=3119039 RepID=A0AAJ1MJS8_9SPIO|nr:aminoacyl-histidine dipeptidase [Spirochaetales bacterium]